LKKSILLTSFVLVICLSIFSQEKNKEEIIIQKVIDEQKSTSLPFDDYENDKIGYDQEELCLHSIVDTTVNFDNLISEVKIPRYVTYKKVDNAVTISAIISFELFLNRAEPIFDDKIFIGPHLFAILSKNEEFRKLGVLKIIPVQIMGKFECYISKIISDNSEKEKIGNYIRNQFSDEKDVNIRKPTINEISWYWTIINYDIEEPILIVELTDKKFLLNFHNNALFFIDDITGLNWNYE
jgi:hypothetical protein